MKYGKIFKSLLNCETDEEVFEFLTTNLTTSITIWSFFVNWKKIFKNFEEIEYDLNTLNFLVGKEDIESAFRITLKNNPEVIRTLPILIATRDKSIQILTQIKEDEFLYKTFTFRAKKKNKKYFLTEDQTENAVEFARKSGIFDLLQHRNFTSVKDYVIGVEVGLDTNARKNRRGKSMEEIVKNLLATICANLNYPYLTQANPNTIFKEFGVEVSTAKTNYIFDFAIKTRNRLYLIETNYYSVGGSKLNSVAQGYRNLSDSLKKEGHSLIWITDGLGWEKTKKPLRDTFDYNDYVLNLRMVMSGILEKILEDEL